MLSTTTASCNPSKCPQNARKHPQNTSMVPHDALRSALHFPFTRMKSYEYRLLQRIEMTTYATYDFHDPFFADDETKTSSLCCKLRFAGDKRKLHPQNSAISWRPKCLMKAVGVRVARAISPGQTPVPNKNENEDFNLCDRPPDIPLICSQSRTHRTSQCWLAVVLLVNRSGSRRGTPDRQPSPSCTPLRPFCAELGHSKSLYSAAN
mmetsp:Transcript_84300/g.140913  ORF Transcript_84300/g.140913 Transcript_84300/m.140913 type:complete len:207 (-) Transcript_84300:213-833(-)